MSSSLRNTRTSTHSCVDIWPPGPSSARSGRSEKPVRDALAEGVRPLMTASGGVRFEDEYRYLIATS